mgnify:CR=1 FL=1
MTLTTYRHSAPTIWDEFFNDFYHTSKDRELTPRAKVTDDSKTLAIKLELPGVNKEDIKVEVENSVLSIVASKKAEKKEEAKNVYFDEITTGEYKRSFKLSDEVEHENVNARYENGILTLELKKKEKAKPRQINVK